MTLLADLFFAVLVVAAAFSVSLLLIGLLFGVFVWLDRWDGWWS